MANFDIDRYLAQLWHEVLLADEHPCGDSQTAEAHLAACQAIRDAFTDSDTANAFVQSHSGICHVSRAASRLLHNHGLELMLTPETLAAACQESGASFVEAVTRPATDFSRTI